MRRITSLFAANPFKLGPICNLPAVGRFANGDIDKCLRVDDVTILFLKRAIVTNLRSNVNASDKSALKTGVANPGPEGKFPTNTGSSG